MPRIKAKNSSIWFVAITMRPSTFVRMIPATFRSKRPDTLSPQMRSSWLIVLPSQSVAGRLVCQGNFPATPCYIRVGRATAYRHVLGVVFLEEPMANRSAWATTSLSSDVDRAYGKFADIRQVLLQFIPSLHFCYPPPRKTQIVYNIGSVFDSTKVLTKVDLSNTVG